MSDLNPNQKKMSILKFLFPLIQTYPRSLINHAVILYLKLLLVL